MSDVSVSMPMEDQRQHRTDLGWGLFTVLLLLVVGGAIIRSAIATRLDGFTIDEAYHIAAGVYYVRLGDFRINPEHPPLVKLWVGSLVASTGFRTITLRSFSDKQDERAFAEQDVYLHNDPDAVQKRARIAYVRVERIPARGPGVRLSKSFRSRRRSWNDRISPGLTQR